jgi:Family of unknown function (DUF6088)
VLDPQSIDNKVLNRVYGFGRGSVFTPARFLDLGSRDAVDKALSRLASKGTIRRLNRGLYDYPKTHPLLGVMSPSADAIARALAGKDQLRLQPSGAYAANLLGLTEQVPMRVVFLTDGSSRRVRIGKQEIILKQTTPRQMAAAGRISGLVIQALRHLGKDNMSASMIDTLRSRLTSAQKKQLLSDVPLAPGWIGKILRQVASENS